jgi:hypothetical protein
MTTFIGRLIGAMVLDVDTFETVEADRSSTAEAMAVVLMSAVATGIGARGFGATTSVIPAIAVASLLAWAAWALLTYEIGVRLLPTSETHADVTELLRTVGFAAAPGILRILGVIPVCTTPVFILTSVWMLLAMVVAVRQALDYTSTPRAVAVCAVGWMLTLVFLVAFGLWATPALSAPRGIDEGKRTTVVALRLHVERDGQARDGVGVPVKRDGDTWYLLTSARLVTDERGEIPGAQTISVELPDGSHVRVADASLPGANLLDLAVLKATIPGAPVSPPLFTNTLPGVGSSFEIVAFDRDGMKATLLERVHHATPLMLVGDQQPSSFDGCEGAAAVVSNRVFGIAIACEPTVSPRVLPFAAIAAWINEYIPGGLVVGTPTPTTFDFKQREISGPTVIASCGETRTQDVDVPFTVSAGEFAIGAKASLLDRHALKVGEVTVLRLSDRSVRLRFTVAGQEAPAFPVPLPCQPTQALVTVRLDIVSRAR